MSTHMDVVNLTIVVALVIGNRAVRKGLVTVHVTIAQNKVNSISWM